MNLEEIWSLKDTSLELILNLEDKNLSDNRNFDRILAATILYNNDKLTPKSRTLVSSPLFIKIFSKTKDVEVSINQLIFESQFTNIFDDENLVKSLFEYIEPESKPILPYIDQLKNQLMAEYQIKKIIFDIENPRYDSDDNPIHRYYLQPHNNLDLSRLSGERSFKNGNVYSVENMKAIAKSLNIPTIHKKLNLSKLYFLN